MGIVSVMHACIPRPSCAEFFIAIQENSAIKIVHTCNIASYPISLSSAAEHGAAFPVDLTVQRRAAVVRQKTLAAQVSMEKQLPLMRELHLPDIARLSAKLYTTMTGTPPPTVKLGLVTSLPCSSSCSSPMRTLPYSLSRFKIQPTD